MMETSPERHAYAPILSLPVECYELIFKHLPRAALKNLRLACKALDSVVVSPYSHLYSRVFLSSFRADLDVLHEICRHPRASQAVRELVWDTSPPSGPEAFDAYMLVNEPPQILNWHSEDQKKGGATVKA
jgi:hypothetical protein